MELRNASSDDKRHYASDRTETQSSSEETLNKENPFAQMKSIVKAHSTIAAMDSSVTFYLYVYKKCFLWFCGGFFFFGCMMSAIISFFFFLNNVNT